MKILIRWTLPLALLVATMRWNGTASAQMDFSQAEDFEGGLEQSAVLTINSNGSCLVATATVQPRTTAEQQVRMWERFEKMRGGEGESGTPAEASSTNETKPFTDEELAKKLTDSMNERADEYGQDSGQNFKVRVIKDSVLITTARTFDTVEAMLQDSGAIWNQSGLMLENARFETDTNGLLRVTLTPRTGMDRYLKMTRSQWKLSGAKTELRLIFPGKVISSGLPEMQTNATWIIVDGKKDESLDALAKLYSAPTVITAEAGDLKLAQPLEAKKLWRSRRQTDTGTDDLPITDAGPGFAAQAQSIATTALHVFPGGEEYFKQNDNPFGDQAGAVVNAKLFAPKGRILLSVGDIHVVSATDDKGRSIVAEGADTESAQTVVTSSFSTDSSDSISMQVELRLQLPQPDAQAIDEISAEAVAVTAGAWQEMTLTNLQADATNELDLSAVLPGAKMVITKFSFRDHQFNLQARLEGPPTVRRLDVGAKMPGAENFNSNTSERSFKLKNGQATRSLTVQGYAFSEQNSASEGSIILVVRCPQDLRRERVKFSLKALDLL